MASKKVRVSYGRTIQSAPYESIRLDIAIEKDVEDVADLKEEIDKSVNGLVSYVKTKVKQILANE